MLMLDGCSKGLRASPSTLDVDPAICPVPMKMGCTGGIARASVTSVCMAIRGRAIVPDVEKELGACQAPTGASGGSACVSCAAKKERRRACPNKCSYGKLSEKREYAPIAVYDMAGNRYRDFDREECLGPDFALPLMWMTRTDCVSDTRPDYLVVARAVREAMGASITRLYCEGDGLKRVYQAWSHHKMCRNVDREHVSNNVWFEITCRGVSQRCHDDDCKGYASPPVPLPPAYYRRLFVSPAGADTSAPLLRPRCACSCDRGKNRFLHDSVVKGAGRSPSRESGI
eukprot:jgi/Mesvir1/8421/Mv04969-RA.1